MANETESQQSPLVLTASFYDSMGANYESAFGHDIGLQNFIQRAITFFPPSSKVLDVGCGTGNPVASTVAAHGHNVIGIDIAQSMVDLSRKAVPSGTFHVANMMDYTPPERMDVVLNMLSLFVLSRKEIESMSKKWAEWLVTGGVLCVGTVDPDELKATTVTYDEDKLCASGIPVLFMGERTQITLMTRDGWKNMLELVGFEVIYTETSIFEPPPEAKSDPEPHYFIIARKLR